MYHFVYKTTNNINGKYYYGVHSTDDLNDDYLGSGKALRFAINKYGKENFSRRIIKFFDTVEEAYKFEAEIVNESIIKDSNCYNIQPGGKYFSPKGFVNAKDEHGNTFWVSKEQFDNNSSYVGIMKDRVVVRDNENNIFAVDVNNENYLNGSYVSIQKGHVIIKTDEGYARITKEEFDNNSSYVGMFKDTIVIFDDISCSYFRVSTNDPRYLSGELKTPFKGKALVKDKNNNKFWVNIDDPRYLSGEFVGHTKGYKMPEHVKLALLNGKKANTYIGITKDGKNKFIPQQLLDKYIADGWVRGIIEHKPKRVCVNKNNVDKLVLPSELNEYIANGWIKGGKKRESGNRVYVNKDGKNRHILKTELESYISDGWQVGRLMRDQHNMIHIHNDEIHKNKFIDKNEFEKYKNEGWKLGMLKRKNN